MRGGGSAGNDSGGRATVMMVTTKGEGKFLFAIIKRHRQEYPAESVAKLVGRLTFANVVVRSLGEKCPVVSCGEAQGDRTPSVFGTRGKSTRTHAHSLK